MPKSPKRAIPPGTVPFKKGPDPRRGRGPKKGAPNAGRPPDAFRALCRDIASKGAQAIVAQKVMQDPTHPAFATALRWATENGYGKAMQAHEHTGKDGKPIETVAQVVMLMPDNGRKRR